MSECRSPAAPCSTLYDLCSTHTYIPQRFDYNMHTYTHTHNPLSGTTRVSRYQKGKTYLDFTEARDSEWHQLGHMQICTLLQTDNHASTPPLSFFTGRMPFLPPNQQDQRTEGKSINTHSRIIRRPTLGPNTNGKLKFTCTICMHTFTLQQSDRKRAIS